MHCSIPATALVEVISAKLFRQGKLHDPMCISQHSSNMHHSGLLSNLNSAHSLNRPESSDHFSLRAGLQSRLSSRLGTSREMDKTLGNLKDKLSALLWGPALAP